MATPPARSGCRRPDRSTWRAGLGAVAIAAGAAWVAPAGFAADTTLAELDRVGRAIAAQRCARPLEVKVSEIRHPRAGVDEMQSIACRGFRVAIYRSFASDPPREMPMAVVVESGHDRLDNAWSVGASGASVRSRFGAPFATRGESFSYSLDPQRPGRDTLEFEVHGGIVRVVTWTWEVDD